MALFGLRSVYSHLPLHTPFQHGPFDALILSSHSLSVLQHWLASCFSKPHLPTGWPLPIVQTRAMHAWDALGQSAALRQHPPVCSGMFVHLPVLASHRSFVHALPSSQPGGWAPPPHTPPLHFSPIVHLSPSSQIVVDGAACAATHSPVALSHVATLQTFPVAHFLAVIEQTID